MLEQLFRDGTALARHRAGPFAEERERYLQNCAEHGATRAALRLISSLNRFRSAPFGRAEHHSRQVLTAKALKIRNSGFPAL
jgi:hypothetical protein